MDKDQSGGIDVEELTDGFQILGLGLSEPELEAFHTFCDFDGDGSISITEFRGAIMEAKRAYLSVEEVQRREMVKMLADPRINQML